MSWTWMPTTGAGTLCALYLMACSGTMSVGTVEDPATPGGDDDDTGADDDDSVVDDDDDDSVGDDDDTVFNYDNIIAFVELNTALTPDGQQEGGWAVGYWYEDGGATRGAGCDVYTPDSGVARGGLVTYDAGPWIDLSLESGWDLRLDAVDDGMGALYYYNWWNANGPVLPLDSWVNLDLPGGADIGPMFFPEAVPTGAAFAIYRPQMPPNEPEIFFPAATDVPFEWEPMGDDRIEVTAQFWDNAADLQWQVTCSTEDDGAFSIPAEWMVQMPSYTEGMLTIRRYVGQWTEQQPDQPAMYLQGSVQYRFPLRLVEDMDGGTGP